MNEHIRRFKKPRSKKIITVISLIFAISVIFTAILLFSRSGELEMSSDYSFLNDYIKGKGNPALVSAAEKFVSDNITVFEDEDSTTKSVVDSVCPNSLSIARANRYTESKPIYTVYADGKAFFTAVLEQSGKTLSGFEKWKIESISIAEGCEVASEAYVEVPHGATVIVNGNELNSGNSQVEKATYFALTEFEKDISDSIYSDRYSIGVFFGQPEVSAVLDGYRLSVSYNSEKTVKFGYPPSSTTVKNITVPYGSTVTVNGITLTGEHIYETGLKYPFLTRFEEEKDGLTRALTYRISGLFNQPEITVKYNGVTLEGSSDGAKYRLPDDLTYTYTILAPEDATVKINGVVLSRSEISKEKAEFPILNELTNYAKDRPYLIEYTVSGLLSAPTVTASDADGNVLSRNPITSTDNRIEFTLAHTSALPNGDKSGLKSFMKAYVKYIYSGNSGQSSNYNSVASMTAAKSLAFTKIQAEYKKLYNADIHKKIQYGDITYSEYRVYCKNTYSCIATIPFTATLDGNTVEKQVTLELLYIYSGKTVRIINYLIIP